MQQMHFNIVCQSKPDSSELGSPKTTDDIVQEKAEDSRVSRRRHKTESVKQQWSHEKAVAVEREQAQRYTHTLHKLFVQNTHPVSVLKLAESISSMALQRHGVSVEHITRKDNQRTGVDVVSHSPHSCNIVMVMVGQCVWGCYVAKYLSVHRC